MRLRYVQLRVVSGCSGRRRLHETCTQAERSCTGSVRDRADDVVVEVQPETPAFISGRHHHRKPTLEDRLIARMLAPWLDAEVARGMSASLSAAHAARAEQLTGEHVRRAVARALDRLVDRAENPRPVSLIRLVPPCREQVRGAMPLIVAVRSRLLSGEPLAAQGIARLKTVLSDRCGPCYVRSGPDALAVALQEISKLLDVRQAPPN